MCQLPVHRLSVVSLLSAYSPAIVKAVVHGLSILLPKFAPVNHPLCMHHVLANTAYSTHLVA